MRIEDSPYRSGDPQTILLGFRLSNNPPAFPEWVPRPGGKKRTSYGGDFPVRTLPVRLTGIILLIGIVKKNGIMLVDFAICLILTLEGA